MDMDPVVVCTSSFTIIQSLVPVPFRACEEHEEVDGTDEGDEEVEPVQLPPVEVLGEPPVVAEHGVGRRAVHHDDQQPAEVHGHRQAGEDQRPGDAAHVLRELLVVELHLAHLVERLREAQRRQLRHQPERRRRRDEGHREQVAVRLRLVEHGELAPALLHDAGDDHGHDGERHAHAHAREQRHAALDAGEPAQPRHHEPVVERDPHRERQHREDGERRRRSLEAAGAEAAVGLRRLQDDVGVGLRERHVVDDAGGPHRHDAEDALGLLHLLQAAQPPRVPGLAAAAAAGVVDDLAVGLHHGGLVEEPELVGVGEPRHERARVARPEEGRRGVLRSRGAALAGRRDGDAEDAGQGDPPLGAHADVEPGAGEEEHAGGEHERGGDGEPDAPAHVALHVDDPRRRAHDGDGQGEVVPVEEAVDPAAAGLRVRVELVGAERQAARPDAAGAHHDEQEGQRQHRELSLGRARALLPARDGAARRRVQRRHAGRQRQDDHALHACHRDQKEFANRVGRRRRFLSYYVR